MTESLADTADTSLAPPARTWTRQYVGMVASSSRDQARMPPARLTAWKPFCCRKFATSQAPATRAAQHDDFAAAIELAEAIGDLAHRNVDDVRHAGHAQLPLFANVKQRQRLAAFAARDEFGRSDFGDGHGQWMNERCGEEPAGSAKVTGSEHECRWPRRVDQRLEHGLEQAFRCHSRSPTRITLPGLHDRRLADDDEQPTADAQRLLEALVVDRQRAGDGDDVVGATARPAAWRRRLPPTRC